MTVAYEYRPGVLYLNVTNRCSNDCDFCVRQGPGFRLGAHDLRLEQEPDAATVETAIVEHTLRRGRPFDEVVFCGFGEPTHRLRLISTVGRRLRAQSMPVRLNTNGQAALIHGGDPMPLLQGAVDHVSISLNAPDAAHYVDLCRPVHGAAAWDALMDFTRAAVARLPRVTLSVVGFALDDDDLERCEALADELGAELRVR